MATCVLQHSLVWREMDDFFFVCLFFPCKNLQISFDDMEKLFITSNIHLVQMHREAFLKFWLYKQLRSRNRKKKLKRTERKKKRRGEKIKIKQNKTKKKRKTQAAGVNQSLLLNRSWCVQCKSTLVNSLDDFRFSAPGGDSGSHAHRHITGTPLSLAPPRPAPGQSCRHSLHAAIHTGLQSKAWAALPALWASCSLMLTRLMMRVLRPPAAPGGRCSFSGTEDLWPVALFLWTI